MSLIELPPGIYPDVPDSVYHARTLGVASKSALDLVHRAPALYRAWIDGAEQEETEALAFGSAFHCALLEPERFDRTYVLEPAFGDCRKTENKNARDAWRKASEGKRPVSCADFATIRGMTDSVRAHPLAGKMLQGGVAEATLRWRDAETGIECKGRADYYVPGLGLVVDVKTTQDARAASFRKSVANFGYHRQEAFYRAGFDGAAAPVEHFVFLAVEKAAPYLVALYELDGDALDSGEASTRVDLRTLARCIERDEWPGYGNSIITLDLPPWAA